MVEKLLLDDEEILNKANVIVDDEESFEIVVTNLRLLFVKESGLIFKNVNCEKSIDLRHIENISLAEDGMIFKKRRLKIKGRNFSMDLSGDSNKILELNKDINEAMLSR